MLLHIRVHDEGLIHASAFGEGGLTCGFNDYMLVEYVQQQRRGAGKLPKSYAVMKVGPQADGLWVLGEDIYIRKKGLEIPAHERTYLWISHLYTGPGIAPQETACHIQLPLSTDPLTK